MFIRLKPEPILIPDRTRQKIEATPIEDIKQPSGPVTEDSHRIA
jgi:hypothetical protein